MDTFLEGLYLYENYVSITARQYFRKEREMDEIVPVKSEEIHWYNFRQRKFPESLKTNQLVLITRTGGMRAEYAKLIDGDVFLDCTGVDGGMLVTNQVARIAKMPIG